MFRLWLCNFVCANQEGSVASIVRVEVIMVKMWPHCVYMVSRNVITQKSGREEKEDNDEEESSYEMIPIKRILEF